MKWVLLHPWRALQLVWRRARVGYLRRKLRRMKPKDRAERRRADRLVGKHRSASKRGRRAAIRIRV